MYAPLNTDPNTGFRPGVGMNGLGYAAGGNGPRGGNRGWNPTLGYSAGSGWIRGIPGLAGLGSLGAISADNQAQLIQDGCDAADVSLASSLGATDADAEAILALTDSDAEESALLHLISTLNDAAAGAAIAAAEANPSSPAAVAALGQSPAGSTLIYTAQYNVNTYVPGGSLLVTPTQVIQALGNSLAGTGLSISGTQASSYGGNSFTVSVQDMTGHALLSDAQSVLDAHLNALTGVTKVSSSISMGVPGSGVQGAAAPTSMAAPSALAWLESNAGYIGLGLAAIFIVPPLIKSFR